MDVWRLASSRHDLLTGDGARRVGGRWNSPGRAMVYTSDSLALALVEALVHLPGALPSDYAGYRIRVPDAEMETLDAGALKTGWMDDLGYTRAIGDQWLSQERSVALVVPSAVLPSGSNVLLNPRHRRAATLRVESEEPLRWDPRLRPGA